MGYFSSKNRMELYQDGILITCFNEISYSYSGRKGHRRVAAGICSVSSLNPIYRNDGTAVAIINFRDQYGNRHQLWFKGFSFIEDYLNPTKMFVCDSVSIGTPPEAIWANQGTIGDVLADLV